MHTVARAQACSRARLLSKGCKSLQRVVSPALGWLEVVAPPAIDGLPKPSTTRDRRPTPCIGQGPRNPDLEEDPP